jgi:hypothetical protein
MRVSQAGCGSALHGVVAKRRPADAVRSASAASAVSITLSAQFIGVSSARRASRTSVAVCDARIIRQRLIGTSGQSVSVWRQQARGVRLRVSGRERRLGDVPERQGNESKSMRVARTV